MLLPATPTTRLVPTSGRERDFAVTRYTFHLHRFVYARFGNFFSSPARRGQRVKHADASPRLAATWETTAMDRATRSAKLLRYTIWPRFLRKEYIKFTMDLETVLADFSSMEINSCDINKYRY